MNIGIHLDIAMSWCRAVLNAIS